MYLSARFWGIQPSEFWDMTLPEYFAELEFHTPDDGQNQYAGKLTEDDVDELRAYMHGAPGTKG